MPYIPNLEPPRPWFAARTYLAQAKGYVDECAKPDVVPERCKLRLGYINVLRALRTLHRLTPDNNLSNLVDELNGYLSTSHFRTLQNLHERFYKKEPNLKQLQQLVDWAIDRFFDVYFQSREREWFEYYEDSCSSYDTIERIREILLEAGVVKTLDEAASRFGDDALAALPQAREYGAFEMALRNAHIRQLRTEHNADFWKYDESDSIRMVFRFKENDIEAQRAHWENP